MIIPTYLKKGDKIGVVSVASKVDPENIIPAIDLLKDSGFEVITGEHAFSSHNQFAATDRQRASDLQKMIDDPEIKAIICSRGGYGTLRMLEFIQWENFIQNPKWIVGFSDITVLHSKLNTLSVASLHSVMPGHFIYEDKPTEPYSILLDALTGKSLKYEITGNKFNKPGNTSGQLVGGNLSVLYSLRGTPFDIETENKILFIEDLGEYLYHLDRMMMNLKTGGKLDHLAGLVVGSFTGMKDQDTPFGKNTNEIIFDAVRKYSYPVVFDFPCGHTVKNFPLKCGIVASLDVSSDKASLTQK